MWHAQEGILCEYVGITFPGGSDGCDALHDAARRKLVTSRDITDRCRRPP